MNRRAPSQKLKVYTANDGNNTLYIATTSKQQLARLLGDSPYKTHMNWTVTKDYPEQTMLEPETLIVRCIETRQIINTSAD